MIISYHKMPLSSSIEIVEDHFRSDAVQQCISRFMHEIAMVNTVFIDTDSNREHQHVYTEIYKKYCDMIENDILDPLFKTNDILTMEGLAKELFSISDANDELVCAPYIFAGTAYEEFIIIVKQWQSSYDDDL